MGIGPRNPRAKPDLALDITQRRLPVELARWPGFFPAGEEDGKDGKDGKETTDE
jgi:hypothetical protein